MKSAAKALVLSAFTMMLSAPAQAQYSMINDAIANAIMSIGSQDQACVIRNVKEFEEAYGPSTDLMQRYFNEVATGKPKSSFFKLNKRTAFTIGEKTSGQLDLDQQTDPLATSGNTVDAEPLRFFRAANFITAAGQWAVRGADRQIVGVYTAMFERENGSWKFLTIKVSGAHEIVEPLVRYCGKPGDELEYDLTATAETLERAQKQFEKRKGSFAAADAKAKQSEARSSARPTAERGDADIEQKRLEKAEEQLANAKTAREKVLERAAEIKRLTVEAAEAERFRLSKADLVKDIAH